MTDVKLSRVECKGVGDNDGFFEACIQEAAEIPKSVYMNLTSNPRVSFEYVPASTVNKQIVEALDSAIAKINVLEIFDCSKDECLGFGGAVDMSLNVLHEIKKQYEDLK